MQTNLIKYILHLADNSLIHGHRLSEWCGHGPVLEVDMAISNIALDNIGAARSLYQYAAELEGNGNTEDTYPYTRDVREFYNILLVELPKGDFAETIAQSLFFDTYQMLFYEALKLSTDERLAAIAEKSLKEVNYHFRFSSEWTQRLGDGTEESKHRMQLAITKYWEYCGEMFDADAVELAMQQEGIAPVIETLKTTWERLIASVLSECGLSYPLQAENAWFQKGGKSGIHTEYMGFILAELQFMQRAYPDSEW
jgi:ring-1,2-phenylacetyl-CoA epoxidase subunit PaaC